MHLEWGPCIIGIPSITLVSCDGTYKKFIQKNIQCRSLFGIFCAYFSKQAAIIFRSCHLWLLPVRGPAGFFFFFWSRQTPRQLGGVIWDFKIRARTFKVVVSVTSLSSTSPLKLALWEKYPYEEQQGIYFSWKRKSFNNGNQLILMLNSTHVFLSELRQILSCLDKNGNKIIISPVQGFPYFPIKNFLKINLLFSDFETCIENTEI